MSDVIKNVLFLCTGNSARSILGEAILTARGAGAFVGYSAGSQPTGQPNPFALRVLAAKGHANTGFTSKSWDVFAGPDAPVMSYIITVCDSAAGETCPVWPGHPVSAHWGLPDPAAATGQDADKIAAFETTYAQLSARIDAFLALPHDSLPPDALRQAMARIAHEAVA